MNYDDFFAEMSFRLVRNAWEPYQMKRLTYLEVSDVHKLYWVSAGAAEWTIAERKYRSTPTSLMLVPANVPVWFRTVTPIKIAYFSFSAKYHRNSIFDYIDCPLQTELDKAETEEIRGLFRQAEPRHENTLLSETLRQESVALRVLSMFLYKGGAELAEQPSRADGIVGKIIRYVNKNPEKDYSLKELSALTHVHESYISRVFKRQLGVSPMKYVSAVRMQRIMDAIGGDEPFCRISERFNFTSPETFSRFVKNNTGMPPAECRRMMREESAGKV